MPSYEYECPACGNVINIYRSFSDPELDYECPQCPTTLKRKWTATPAIFRGGGWGGSK